MADEQQANEAEELQAVDAVEQELDEDMAQAEQEVAEALADDAEPVAPTPELDERVETAVLHVAEEAAADAAAAEAAAQQDVPAEQAPRRERRSKQARAEKAAREGASEARAQDAPAPAKAPAALGTPAWIAISVASLALGLLLGRFVLGGGSAAGSAALAGKTTVAEAELDDTFATYTYNGEANAVSIRTVIEQNGTLDAARTDEGDYKLPPADYALNVVRTEIVNKEVASRGIEVTDDDVAAYAEKALGTSDYDAIASTYGMDADTVKELIYQNCQLNALREEIVGTLPEMPEAPATPEEGKEDELTKDYADYIIALAGDEWDAAKGEWASDSSAYATALSDSGFTAEGASYNMAQTAYYVAYQQYSEQQTEASTAWTTYLNGLLSNASIEIATLITA